MVKLNVKTTFIVCLSMFSLQLKAENHSPSKAFTFPSIGSTNSTEDKNSNAVSPSPFYQLTSCSQGLGLLQFNSAPVNPAFRTVIADTTYWGSDHEGNTIQHYDKVKNYIFIGNAGNPKIASLSAESISTYPVKIFAFDFPDYTGKQSGDFQPAAAFKELNKSYQNGYVNPVTFSNYPEIDRAYVTFDENHVIEYNLPMESVIEINTNKRNLNYDKQILVANEIETHLRKGMDSFVDAMVFKARERVGLEQRTRWHESEYDMRGNDFNQFKEAFCNCKDLKGFEGFELSTYEKLLSPDLNFGSFLIWGKRPQDSELKSYPANNSDLNCNLS